MNLLIRIIRFLAVLAIRLMLGLIAVFSRFIVLPFLLATLRVSGRLVFTSLTATVTGPTEFTDRLASEWTRRVLEMGIRPEDIDRVFRLCRFLVASMIILGWLVATLFTVAVLRVVFGLFI
jgi:hypothetical protein